MKNTMQQHVAEVKYTGYASGNELVWTRGAGLQLLPDGTKLYAASVYAPTPVAYLDVGAGGYMYLGTDLTEDQVVSIPWGRHILAIVGTYGADGYVPAERPFDYTEAYQGARQDLAIWKRRALEAEQKVREQDQIIDRMGDDMNAINGPTFMGEPVLPKRPAEQDIQKAINDAPEALRELGVYLGRLLDEDRWPEAKRKLEAAALAVQPVMNWRNLYHRASLDLCAIGELLGVPEEDQCTPDIIEAIKELQKKVPGSNQRTNAQVHGCAYPGWECFHCGETFETVGAAEMHFGATPDATPGCLIKVQLGEERGLLIALRKAEAKLAEQQPSPDVAALVEALEQCVTSMIDSGYRADAVVIQAARAALAAYRKQGGDL